VETDSKMTAGAPWSVKGIDPKAREIAKDLARRSGMTLGEWLNQVILEDGPAADEAPAFTPYGREPAQPPLYRRFETPEHPGDELARVTRALEQLSARIEAAEHRSTLAISGVDQSVSGLVSRLSANEREQTAIAARFEGLADDLKVDQSRITERLRRIEQEAAGPRSAEALRTMEQALGKVAGHLYEGEARTTQQLSALSEGLKAVTDKVENGPAGVGAGELVDTVVARVAERLEQAGARTSEAIRGLEVSFAHLDERLAATEARGASSSADAGLERLAVSLSARVDAARAEMAEKIRASADGRFDRMERTLAEMNGHVQAAERRSAQAIERMGHEVLRMAETLSRKVSDVEQHSAGAIQQVSGEVGRIATVMETRLTHMDTAGAQALEKLGGEIARITERLAERIANAERRSAQAIDDVGDQMTRASERMQERSERVSSELAERIRQSEERTAKLLEDARERIDQRLGETQRRVTEAVTQPPAPSFVEPGMAPFGQSSFSSAPLPDNNAFNRRFPGAGLDDDDLIEPAALPESSFQPRVAAPARAPAPPLDEADLLTPHGFEEDDEFAAPSPFGEPSPFAKPAAYGERQGRPAASAFDDLEAAAADDEDDGFLKPSETPAAPAYSAETYAEPPTEQTGHQAGAEEAPFARPSSTRELIDQARAAARASTQDTASGKKPRAEAGRSLFSGFGLARPKKSKKAGPSMKTMLLLSGVVAAAGVSTAGYVLINDKPTGATPARVVDGQTAIAQLATSEISRPLAAVALNPTPLAGANETPATPVNPAAAVNGPALYEDGARRIEAHDFTGVDSLRKAANLGYAPAEFYLAKLYEDGQAGLRKDMNEARVWTERAAEAGDRKAMHNLALYYFEGSGGPKNMTTAADWFRKAADLGLVDSQYNLARLYEKGFGVSQNPAEAYKWYLIAARSGDADSRASAQQLKAQLSPQSQAAAERAAAGFRPQGPDATGLAAGLNITSQIAQATGGAPNTANLQRALSRLGYYQGPTDGVSSPALRLAIAAYQRDQGLPGTGNLDPSSEQLLYAAAQ
jgi:localization factor PodJL